MIPSCLLTSRRRSQCHQPAFAMFTRRRRVDECRLAAPERQQDTSAVTRFQIEHTT